MGFPDHQRTSFGKPEPREENEPRPYWCSFPSEELRKTEYGHKDVLMNFPLEKPS